MSNAPREHDTIEQRLARLERSLRRWRAGGVCALLVALAGMALGQAQTDTVVTANKFVLVSADGQERGVLSLDDAGEPYLELTSPRSPQRNVVMSSGTETAGVLANWENGYQAALGVTPSGAVVSVGPAPRVARAGMFITPELGPVVAVYNAAGQAHWRTPQIND